jgi:hypothetical protein
MHLLREILYEYVYMCVYILIDKQISVSQSVKFNFFIIYDDYY